MHSRVTRGALLAIVLAPLLNVVSPHTPTALLTYLQVGSVRIGLTVDTLVEHGRRVPVGFSSLAHVQKILTAAEIGARGDAASSLKWVCYRLSGDAPMSLLLESDEMGGGDVDGFELVPAGSRRALEHKCARLDVPASAVETDKGIRLGLSRRQVEGRLGVAGRDSAGVVIFERMLDKVGRRRDGMRLSYTEAAGFTIRFRNDHVMEIVGWRMDTT